MAERTLEVAGRLWFLAAVLGQWIFVAYVVLFYGGTALRGKPEAWNEVLPHGYVRGDTMGNGVVAIHLFLAVVIMVGGPLQMVARIRRYAPSLHRLNGRLYMLAVCVTSIAGLYMVWSRGGPGLIPHVGVSLDAVLIMSFAVLAVRRAMAGDIRAHRRWALRLFMVVNAGWFFRIGLMQWLFLYQGPVGFDPKTFTGPFISFLSFADYLLPLAMLELYLRARDRSGAGGRFAMAAALLVLTMGMGLGMFVATRVLWLPRIQAGASLVQAGVVSVPGAPAPPRLAALKHDSGRDPSNALGKDR